MIEKVLIVGSGPAGLTAAIYAGRANLNPVCLEGPEAGGQLMTTTDVENFPGFPSAITGPGLIDEMHKQAERFGARFVPEIATNTELGSRPFKVHTETQTLLCETLIIASGASARWLGIESEQKLRGHGVSSCATCDGFFFRGKEVLVVGGGDTAMEEALFLTRFCRKVTVVHRRAELRASPIMAERARRNEKIRFVWDSVVHEIRDPDKQAVTAAVLRNVKTGSLSEIPCEGVFIAIGHTPNTAFLKDQLELNKEGFLVCRNTGTATSIPGVFGAGDVMDPHYRQAITAAGTGCMAAIDAERFLEATEW